MSTLTVNNKVELEKELRKIKSKNEIPNKILLRDGNLTYDFIGLGKAADEVSYRFLAQEDASMITVKIDNENSFNVIEIKFS